MAARSRVTYPYESITYRYDAATNRYVRYINASTTPQIDRNDGQIVAPANVVVLRMAFGPLNDGHPSKHRLEARDVGKGQALDLDQWGHDQGHLEEEVARPRRRSCSAPTARPSRSRPDRRSCRCCPLSYAFTFVPGTAATWQPPMQVRGIEPL